MKKILMRFGIAYFACPIVGFILFGAYAMYQQALLIEFGLFLVASALLTSGLLWLLSFKKKGDGAVTTNIGSLPELEPGVGWGEQEIQAWSQINAEIDGFIKQEVTFDSLRDNATIIAGIAAKHCSTTRFNSELGFTLPEFMLMTEEVSRRYREYLMAHVPFADKMKLSTIKTCYDHKDTANMAWNAYRLFRVTSPLGLMSELRSMIASEIFDGFTEDFMDKLLKVYYQEIGIVAINLYSRHYDGKLVSTYTASYKKDLESIESNIIEPIRIAVIGETSAGKSTLVNTMFGKVMAEVSALPTTEGKMSYHLQNDNLDVMLVDTEGYGGKPNLTKKAIDVAVMSDLVIVAVKANKPSKSADLQALKALKEKIEKNPKRKKPYILVCLSHTDLINDDIQNVIDYNMSVFDPVGVVDGYCVSNKDLDGTHGLQQQIIDGYEYALTAQLNRKRIDKSLSDGVVSEIKRAGKLSKEAFKLIMA